MAIVGFNFLKISCEKKNPVTGQVKINYNVSIKEVLPGDMHLGQTVQKGLRFIFEFSTKYEVNVGELIINGELLWMDKEERVNDVLESWKNKKAIDPAVMQPIMNTVWSKSIIQAIILSKEVNLPAPIQMPKINVQAKPIPAAMPKKEEKKAPAKK